MREHARLGRIGIAIAVLAAALALSGCGRRGALEAPPSAAALADAEDAAAGGMAADERPDPVAPSPKPQRRFFLDFLL